MREEVPWGRPGWGGGGEGEQVLVYASLSEANMRSTPTATQTYLVNDQDKFARAQWRLNAPHECLDFFWSEQHLKIEIMLNAVA